MYVCDIFHIFVAWFTRALTFANFQVLLVSVQYDVVLEAITINVQMTLTNDPMLKRIVTALTDNLYAGPRLYCRGVTIFNAADVAVEPWHVALQRINADVHVQVFAHCITINSSLSEGVHSKLLSLPSLFA